MGTLPIFATLEPLEKVGVYTPLGIRFWDAAADVAVTDGLEVTARPPEQPHLRRRAFQTASGIYAFRNLPGLRSLEVSDPDLPAGIHPVPSSPPQSWRFIVEMADWRERFIPVNFQVDLPYRGIFPIQPAGSPTGSGLPGFLLFSAPGRTVPPGLAVVRSQLVERLGPTQTRPASHAVVEVLVPGQPTWIGIADLRGSIVVAFPYPRFATTVEPFSPPNSATGPRMQSWDIVVRVRYLAAHQDRPDSVAGLPDLGAILTQPAAALWLDSAGPGRPELNAQLLFGQPLILQTAGTSELWIET